MTSVPGPNKSHGREEPEEEQTHPPSQTQTWQITKLAEVVLAVKERHDVAEEQ